METDRKTMSYLNRKLQVNRQTNLLNWVLNDSDSYEVQIKFRNKVNLAIDQKQGIGNQRLS